jgi:hypothetical protein
MTQRADFDAIEICPDRELPASIAERWVSMAVPRWHSRQCAVRAQLERLRRVARDLSTRTMAQRRRTARPV